jgi:uncharacterized membrane protein HdeD (DUF308 family)
VWTRAIFGVLLILVGGVWIGQGVGVIHGSFMTDKVFWAVVGSVVLVIGATMLISALRSRSRRTA